MATLSKQAQASKRLKSVQSQSGHDMKLSFHEERLHSQAQSLSQKHRELEAKLCACLREIDQTRLYRKLGVPSLFQYAVRVLKFSEATAYAFITVSRASRAIPELKAAIEESSLSVIKASRVVSALNSENAKDIIEYAKSHTSREIDLEMAKRNPRMAKSDRIKPLTAETFELRAQISRELQAKIKRLESILAQKGQATALSHLLEFAVSEALRLHDPVLKAERALKKKSRAKQALNETQPPKRQSSNGEVAKSASCPESLDSSPFESQSLDAHISESQSLEPHSKSLCLSRVFEAAESLQAAKVPQTSEHIEGCDADAMDRCVSIERREANEICDSNEAPDSIEGHASIEDHVSGKRSLTRKSHSRRSLPSDVKHALYSQTQGRCTHVNELGERCSSDRYLHIHHIKPLSQGGTDELTNLTVLCSFHHELVHQLSLPLDGQFNWLRSPVFGYQSFSVTAPL